MSDKRSVVLLGIVIFGLFLLTILPGASKAQTTRKSVKRTSVKRKATEQKTMPVISPCSSIPNETFVISAKENNVDDNTKPSKPTDSLGILNGKASNLVTPPYPPAARTVHASGAVNVQVTIDEQGNVISAKAISGHPFLQRAAEQAASQSKFSPTVLNGCPVRVSGIIVYNFAAQ